MAEALQFGVLLGRPGFRADLLYFIRLAGNYAASVIIECREKASDKNKAEFAKWLGMDVGADRKKAPIEKTAKALEDRLWAQFIARNPSLVSAIDKKPLIKKDIWRALAFKHPWFDVFKTDCPLLLSEMPITMRERLSRSLQKDHLLPWTSQRLVSAIEQLTKYRHWLEHAEDRIAKGELRPSVSDEQLLEILGLMLLPHLGNHLVGRIRHHARQAGMRGMAPATERAKAILALSLASRREASKFMNGLKRRSDHDTIRARITRKFGNEPGDAAVHRIAKQDAKERRDLEHQKAAMLALHRRYFDEATWPRYNHEKFLIRFSFIGRRRISALEEKLGIAADERPDFINAIEPAFILATDMALVIHVWLTELEQAGIPVRDKKAVGAVVPALRNGIAHGEWLWTIADASRAGQNYSFAELLAALLALPALASAGDKRRWRNDLITRLEALLRPCGWTHVYSIIQPGDDPNQLPARYVVKRWTQLDRARFADRSRWRLEKRPALRRLAAAWMRDLTAARLLLQKN